MIEFSKNLSLSNYCPQWTKPRVCLVLGLAGVISAVMVAIFFHAKKEYADNPIAVPPQSPGPTTPPIIPENNISKVSIPILSKPEIPPAPKPLPEDSNCALLSKNWEAGQLQEIQDQLDGISETYELGWLKFYNKNLLTVGRCRSSLDIQICRFEENKKTHSKLTQRIEELNKNLPTLYGKFKRQYSSIEKDYWLLVDITKTAEKMCDSTTKGDPVALQAKYKELEQQMAEIRERYPNLHLPTAVPEVSPLSVKPDLTAVYINCLKKLENLENRLNDGQA